MRGPAAVGRVRRGRRRVGHRHRQGGQPAADQRGRADGLRQPAGRARPRPGRTRSSRWSPCRPRPAPGPESTTICVLDVLSLKVKTGISHARLRPTLAVVDPALTLTQPAGVTASAGMDILCHALESYTARWYTDLRAQAPEQRVPYCGANPISDMWSEKALRLLAGVVPARGPPRRRRRRAGRHGAGRDVRRHGVRQRGVHIPHANAYPIAGQVRDFHPKDYPGRRADGAARHVGVADRARGVPVHVRGVPGAARPRRATARPGADRPDGPGGAPPVGTGRPDARHRDPQRGRGSRLPTRATSTAWWTGR